MNIKCTKCNQHKRDENFTTLALQSAKPVCNSCDLKMVMARLSQTERTVGAIRNQQSVVKAVANKVEKVLNPTKARKQTAKGFLSSILSAS